MALAIAIFVVFVMLGLGVWLIQLTFAIFIGMVRIALHGVAMAAGLILFVGLLIVRPQEAVRMLKA